MNTKLVVSLIQIIQSLSEEESTLLEQKLADKISYSSAKEIENLVQIGGAFDFLYDEPDIYTLEDGEPIQWH
ncbi:hypothetical protein [Aphanothece sacrum]|uniref:Multidrug ABC transporter ATPase n=1 Tax=Aphanothece sacrum FPU1 TaxID=1920663 RepID=A0A401IDJ8_APHSA|nr:hypothetical protein [Aphanothece sacrum]GBF79250.1 multidrug ABC transporter ATPase [Aphanothece sacrum FPU1]GBF86751.1 multidrug ABC transporter ATPase [Aphanothece sacrum FPU3]